MVEVPLWLVLLGLVTAIYFVWMFTGIVDKLHRSEKKVGELESKISRIEPPKADTIKNPPPLNFGPGYD